MTAGQVAVSGGGLACWRGRLALPSIQRGLQASFSGLLRVIVGYALTPAGALLAAGSLALPETGFPQTLEAVAHVPGAGWRAGP